MVKGMVLSVEWSKYWIGRDYSGFFLCVMAAVNAFSETSLASEHSVPHYPLGYHAYVPAK